MGTYKLLRGSSFPSTSSKRAYSQLCRFAYLQPDRQPNSIRRHDEGLGDATDDVPDCTSQYKRDRLLTLEDRLSDIIVDSLETHIFRHTRHIANISMNDEETHALVIFCLSRKFINWDKHR